MKIIVYPHELIVGGSPINAIDLAATVRDLGHEAIIFAKPGPLIDYIASKDLPFVPARRLRYRPGPTRIAQLANLARRERVDLIHGYEWPPCLDAYFGAHLVFGVPLVCTVLSNANTPLVPDSAPLLLGTVQLAEEASEHRSGVHVMEPPIDTDRDHPGIDGRPFRDEWKVRDEELLVVMVCRLAIDLKLEALVRAIDAVGSIAGRFPVRLVIVGGGEAEPQLRRRAEAVNSAAGREVVTLAGPMLDPRPAYAAADLVLGMGSSALRAMAFAKPVVVQGEQVFSRIFERETSDYFFWFGFYGIGDGKDSTLLAEQIAELLADPERRARIGRYGRQSVEDRFSLRAAAQNLLKLYEETIASPVHRVRLIPEAMRMAGRAAENEFRLHLPSDKRARRAAETQKLAAAAGTGGAPT